MKNYTLTFTQEQLNTISSGLLELPGKFGIPVINAINQQLQAAHDKAKDEKPQSGTDAP